MVNVVAYLLSFNKNSTAYAIYCLFLSWKRTNWWGRDSGLPSMNECCSYILVGTDELEADELIEPQYIITVAG